MKKNTIRDLKLIATYLTERADMSTPRVRVRQRVSTSIADSSRSFTTKKSLVRERC